MILHKEFTYSRKFFLALTKFSLCFASLFASLFPPRHNVYRLLLGTSYMLPISSRSRKKERKKGHDKIRRREERRREEEAPNFLKDSAHVPGETPRVPQETPQDLQGTPHEPQAGGQVLQGEDLD
jgi:hypothetical protein